MDRFDHWVKRTMKQKHYVRYVDDFVVLGMSRDEAMRFKEQCEDYLKDTLNLELSKWHVSKIKRGCNFVGFRTWKKTRFVRKHSLHNFSRALKDGNTESLISIIGNAKNTATYKYFQTKLQEKSA